MTNQQDRHIDYLELSIVDLEAAKAFYGGAFAWTFTDWGDEYVAFSNSGLEGGFRKVDTVHTGGPLVILYAQDLEAVEAAVREHGGKIIQEAFEFPGGRRFEFTDPSGNHLAVWSK